MHNGSAIALGGGKVEELVSIRWEAGGGKQPLASDVPEADTGIGAAPPPVRLRRRKLANVKTLVSEVVTGLELYEDAWETVCREMPASANEFHFSLQRAIRERLALPCDSELREHLNRVYARSLDDQREMGD